MILYILKQGWCRFATFSAALFFLQCLTTFGANDRIVVQADVQESPDRIVFSIDALSTGGPDIQIARRIQGDTGTASWVSMATVPDSTTSWTDNGVSRGVVYEYQFYRPSDSEAGFDDANAAYVSCGIEAAIPEDRGHLLLVIESSMATALADELSRLEMDLVGDGWTVIRLLGPRHVSNSVNNAALAEALRQDIRDVDSTPGVDLNAVYLFGRLPIVRSGDLSADGHGAYSHPTDSYYVEMDGEWSDTFSFGIHTPGDGFYDNDYLPSANQAIEALVGRVDLAGMTVWTRSETELLRDYLDKSHNFRMATQSMPRNGLWDNLAFDDSPFESQALSAMFGASEVVRGEYSNKNGATYNTEDQTYLWTVEAGDWNGNNYPNYRFRTHFTVNFASHKQKWERNNNPMRSILAMPEFGLSCFWGVRPNWLIHYMGMGETIGYCNFRTANNRTREYKPSDDYNGYTTGGVQINLMGDPTLRLHPVAPPSQFAATVNSGDVELSWIASSDPEVLGYHVYRADARLGPYARLNPSLIDSATSFTDETARTGDVYYMVRSVKKEVTPVGSYTNLSQGIFTLVYADDSVNRPPTAVDQTIDADPGADTSLTVVGSDPDSDPIVITKAVFPQHGTLEGTAPNFTYRPDPGYQGPDQFQFHVWDGITQATGTVSITVINTPPVANDDTAVVLADGNSLIDVLANDVDTTPLGIVNLTQPVGGSGSVVEENGEVRFTGNATAGEFTDTFTYRANDGTDLSDPATVSLQIVQETGSYDGDSDDVPDGWEVARYGTTEGGGELDYDEDGVSDATEHGSERNPDGHDRVTLDFVDNFDDRGPGLLGDHPAQWSLQGMVSLQDGTGNGGTRGLSLQPGSGNTATAVQYLDTSFEPVVWTDFRGLFQPFELDAETPELEVDATVAFYLDENGDLHVCNGGTWQVITLGLDVAAMHWVSIRQDFVGQVWEIWINGALATPSPLSFVKTRGAPAYFRVSLGGTEPGALDELRIRRSAPTGLAGLHLYETWRSGIDWLGQDDSDSGDPNGNGLSNLEEYGLGYDQPVTGSHAYQTGLVWDDGGASPAVELTYRRNRLADDLIYQIETSSNLIDWTRHFPAESEVTVSPIDAETDSITLRIPATGDSMFMRLVIVQPAP